MGDDAEHIFDYLILMIFPMSNNSFKSTTQKSMMFKVQIFSFWISGVIVVVTHVNITEKTAWPTKYGVSFEKNWEFGCERGFKY